MRLMGQVSHSSIHVAISSKNLPPAASHRVPEQADSRGLDVNNEEKMRISQGVL